jgi:hypothetical protein
MRLIDADALKMAFEEDGHLSGYIEEYIDDAPSVDAVPVVHARWVHEQRYGDSGGWVWRCTACRRESITPIIFAMKYCNACGAKMDAKGDEESE